MNVGTELARARNEHGLSLEELSTRTKVSVERLAAIEQADIDQLPPVIYLRGFLRAYAKEVGLDPDDVATRYIAQFQEQAALAEFDSEDELDSELVVPPPLLEREGSLRPPPAVHTQRASASREPQMPPRPVTTSRAPYGWLAVLAVMAVIAGYFLSANFDTLWPRRTAASVADARTADPQEATQSAPTDEVASAGSRSSPSGDSAAAAPDPQKTVAEPSDADRRNVDAGETPRATEDSSASGSQRPALGRSGGQAAPDAETRGETTSERRAQRSAPPPQTEPAPPAATTDRRQTATVESDPRPQRPVEPEPAPLPSPADPVGEAPADDVSGSWTMINQVASTSYNRFKDLKIGYRLQLEQSGNRVTGHGLKWMENGREIASGSRTPITLDGIIEGRRLELRFSERGSRRASGGMFLMQLADDGSLHGTFTSDAARSSGSSQARRMNSARE